MIISVAIADSNREYTERLTEVLQNQADLKLSVFTGADKLMKSLETESYDILLFDPDISMERLYFPRVKLAVCLYSEEAVNSSLYSDLVNVHKYQRISAIYKEVLKHYADKAGYQGSLGSLRYSTMYAVYSPAGGSGKTLLSIALSAKLAEAGREVLYLSLEQLSAASEIFPWKEEGITKLIETLSTEASFELKLKGIAKKGVNTVHYLEGFRRIADYKDTTGEEIRELLSQLKHSGEYDCIVVDMGSHMDAIRIAVWEEADRIVLIQTGGETASEKMELFWQQGIVLEHKNKLAVIYNRSENSILQDLPCIGRIRDYGRQTMKMVLQNISQSQEIDISRL